METKQTCSALKKAFEGKFPINGQRLFSLWYERIIHPLYWGYWRDDEYGRGQRPWNTNDTLEKGWGRRLSKSRLFSHFLAQEKSQFVFYVPSMGNILNGLRLIVPMFDIDDKKGGGDASLVFNRLKSVLPMVRFYSCPSTSGKGIHAFACLGFPAYWNAGTISDALHVLSRELSSLINDGSFKAGFDRITATPTMRSRGQVLERGVLGKVPTVRTDEEVGLLLAALSHMTEWGEIERTLRLDGKSDDKDDDRGLPQQHSAVLAGPSTAGGSQSGEKGGRCTTEQLAGSIFSPNRPLALPPDDIESLRTVTDTLARRQGFAFKVCRLVGRPLSAEELIGKYEASGLATGPRTEARSTNFVQIAEYVSATFNASKAESGFRKRLDGARSILASRLTEALVAQEYGRKANRSRLTREDVAVVYAMYLLFSARKENVAIARTAALSFSQTLKKSGVIDRAIDYKRFAAAKRILEHLGLIKLKFKARKGATAATYAVVWPSDSANDNSTGIPEPPKSGAGRP